MIAIAVVASLVVYAWVTGYIGGTTSTAGKAIQIQSFASVGGNLVVYVQNVGDGDVELNQDQSVYVDSNLVSITTPNQAKIPIAKGDTVALTTDAPYTAGTSVNIKVTTTDGTFMTITGTGGSGSPGGSTPTLTLTPNSGPVGTPVGLSGSNYAAGTLTATFGGSTVWTGTASSGAIPSGASFNIPTGAITGAVTVTDSASHTGTATLTVTTGPGPATKLVITTGTGQTLHPNQVSQVITVQRQDANGIPTTTGSIQVDLTSSYTFTDHFYDSNMVETDHIHIQDTQNSAVFYFMDSTSQSFESRTLTVHDHSGVLTDDTTTAKIDPYSDDTKGPTSTSGDWTSGTNAYTDGSGAATSPTAGQIQKYSGYGFNLPSDAVIVSVTVRLHAWDTAGSTDRDRITLAASTNGGTSFLSTTATLSLSSSESSQDQDVTGWTTWTAAYINNIGVQVTHSQRNNNNDQINLDWIPIEVQYYVP
jgi:hypothetical protein